MLDYVMCPNGTTDLCKMLLATVWMAKPRTTSLNENGGTIGKDAHDCDAYRLQATRRDVKQW